MSPERKILARYQALYRAPSKPGPWETGTWTISSDLQALLDVLAQLPNQPIVILAASSEHADECKRCRDFDDQPAAMLAVHEDSTEQKKRIDRPSADRMLHPLRLVDLDIVPAISLEVQLGFSTGWFQPALRAFSVCVTTCATRCLTAVSQSRLPGAIDGAPRHLIRRGLRSLQKSLAFR